MSHISLYKNSGRLAKKGKAAGNGGRPASGCLAHKGPGDRLPHHQQHFSVEAVGLCNKLLQIVVFNDVAVFDDAHPLFFNLHPLAQQPVPPLRHFAFVPHVFPVRCDPRIKGAEAPARCWEPVPGLLLEAEAMAGFMTVWLAELVSARLSDGRRS
jgi:hypothetical protein